MIWRRMNTQYDGFHVIQYHNIFYFFLNDRRKLRHHHGRQIRWMMMNDDDDDDVNLKNKKVSELYYSLVGEDGL